MTNLEMLEMQRNPTARSTPPMDRVGRIQFSQAAWEGNDQFGVDFPFLFAQLGLVPIDISTDLRTRIVFATYRWFAFPAGLEVALDTVTEYRITVGYVMRHEAGESRPEVVKLFFQPVNNAAIREQIQVVKTDHCWVVNPAVEDLANLPESHDAIVTGGARHEVRTRRIVVRS